MQMPPGHRGHLLRPAGHFHGSGRRRNKRHRSQTTDNHHGYICNSSIATGHSYLLLVGAKSKTEQKEDRKTS